MRPRIILHIGLPKTGTSAIQSALDASRDALLARSAVLYPAAGVARNTQETGHHNLPRQIRGLATFDPACGVLDDILAEIVSAAPEVAVLSSEGLWELAAHDPAQFSALVNRFAEIGEVDIALVMRPEDTFLESSYLQSLRGGHVRAEFERHLAMFEPRIERRMAVLDAIAARARGRLCLGIYDPRINAVESLLALVGLPGLAVDLEDPAPRKNLRWGIRHYASIAFAFQRYFRNDAGRQDKLREVGTFARREFPPGPTNFGLLSSADRALVKAVSWDHVRRALASIDGGGDIAAIEETWFADMPTPVLPLTPGMLEPHQYRLLVRFINDGIE
mgnify:CR=1 FL=1